MTTQDLLVRVTISFSGPDQEQNEEEARNLFLQLDDLDEIDKKVQRIPVLEAETGGKKGLGFLPGWLTMQVNIENTKLLLSFLSNRLAGKSIELEVEGNGKKLKVKAGSEKELKSIIAEAEKFLQG